MQKGGFFMNYQELNFMLKELSRIPYPKVSCNQPDDHFGKMVYNAYAGSKSELTTILSYVFEYLTNEEYEEVVNFLKMISKQEMKHLELLGEILVSLGLEPYYMNTYGNKWCSDNVKPKCSCLEEMLAFNIEMEKEAIEGYEHLVKVCADENIKAVIKRIIMDEESHVQIFEYLRKKHCECEK